MQMESSKHQGTPVVGGPTTIFAPLHSLQGRPPSSGPYSHTEAPAVTRALHQRPTSASPPLALLVQGWLELNHVASCAQL